jgi:CarboxypepD_reg-like domain
MRQKTLVFLILVGFLNSASAQSVTVKGIIKDIKGIPIHGASVTVSNTKNGTSTDSTGAFLINLNRGATFTVSAVGYIDTTLTIDRQVNFSITLIQKTNGLQEVTVSAQPQPNSQQITAAEVSNEQTVGHDLQAFTAARDGGGKAYIDHMNFGLLLPIYHQPVETKGSRYLIHNWTKGIVVNSHDTVIINNSFWYNFDKVTGDLMLTQDQQSYIDIDRSSAKSFILKSATGDIAFEQVPLIDPSSYFEILAKGEKYAVYKLVKCKLVKANGVANGLTSVGNDYDEFTDENTYYFVDQKNRSAKTIDLRKKSIEKAAVAEKDKSEKYFDEHQKENIDDVFLKGLVVYLNS